MGKRVRETPQAARAPTLCPTLRHRARVNTSVESVEDTDFTVAMPVAALSCSVFQLHIEPCLRQARKALTAPNGFSNGWRSTIRTQGDTYDKR